MNGPLGAGRGVEDLLRRVSPEVLGAVARWCGDLDDAQDGVQEALLVAATRWPRDGVPDNPAGWLIRAAARRVLDQRRSDEARRRREAAAARALPPAPVPDRDDSLVLLFACCHPALPPPAAVALTLRAVGGLSTAEIARAFLVPEPTMAQRISRAKQRVRASGVPIALPDPEEWDGRLRSVLHVLYVIFSEGHVATSGAALVRPDLAAEAIRLARLLHAARPQEPEVAGLLALLLLTEARRPARTGPGGELVPLDEQDRSRWDPTLVGEGVKLLDAALAAGRAGPYQVQAAIAALHDEAARASDTDWPQILALYGLLERMTGNPMVTLNRAVALAMVRGPAAGLRLLGTLEDRLAGQHRLDAVRGHLLERAGDPAAAAACFRTAAGRTTSVAERDYLSAKASRLEP